jgi:hypothetical protein
MRGSESIRLWTNKKLPAQKADGRYKGNPHNGGMVL